MKPSIWTTTPPPGWPGGARGDAALFFRLLRQSLQHAHLRRGGRHPKIKATPASQLAAADRRTPEEIVFTSCGTESDSTAIWAALESNPGKRHLVTSRVEHPAVKNLYEVLGQKGLPGTTFVPVDGRGRLDLDYLFENLATTPPLSA
jgi:cysteine desulfurase